MIELWLVARKLQRKNRPALIGCGMCLLFPSGAFSFSLSLSDIEVPLKQLKKNGFKFFGGVQRQTI